MSAVRNHKIIIAGGGTGGHIFPAIAIANAIKKYAPNTEILFVGAKGKMEMEKVPAAGYKIEGLDIAGFNRSSLLKNLSLPMKIVKSFFQVRNIFKRFYPDACIGVGGYSSYPVLKYAQQKGIKTYIHESNSFAGKANIALAKKASKVFTATDGMAAFFPKDKIFVSGNPVRSSIANNHTSREDGLQFFGLDAAKTTVLSVGGSLGAQSINEAIAENIDLFAQNDLQLIWQTGKPFADRAKEISAGKKNVWVGDFITEMQNGYAAADLVISRSGAMALSELCIVGKPVVFVPYPFAAEDHQTENAKVLVKKDAAMLIANNEAKLKLVNSIIALAKDKTKQATLAANIKKLAITNADEVIAKEILKSLES